jgi:hypothetical protein
MYVVSLNLPSTWEKKNHKRPFGDRAGEEGGGKLSVFQLRAYYSSVLYCTVSMLLGALSGGGHRVVRKGLSGPL